MTRNQVIHAAFTNLSLSVEQWEDAPENVKVFVENGYCYDGEYVLGLFVERIRDAQDINDHGLSNIPGAVLDDVRQAEKVLAQSEAEHG